MRKVKTEKGSLSYEFQVQLLKRDATYLVLVIEVNLCHYMFNLLTGKLPRSEVKTAGNAVVAVKCHLHETLDPRLCFRRFG